MRAAISLCVMLWVAATSVMGTKIIVDSISYLVPSYSGTLVTDDGHKHYFNGKEGCGNRGIDFVQDMCIDPGQSRAHIYWKNQPGRKYCFRKTSSKTLPCTRFAGESCWKAGICPTCWQWEYTAATCNW